jgi:hypothetical protein
MSDDHKTTSAPLSANGYPGSRPFSNVNNEHAEVDELILELVDYKNDYADMAAEKLLRKCSQLESVSVPTGPRTRCVAS